MRRALRPYLPNTSTRLSLIAAGLRGNGPDPLYHWPVRLTQIFGGKRWSLSLIWYRTESPVLTTHDSYAARDVSKVVPDP